jgi:EmrB/QacA subfamily drug resistance transporter
MVEKAKNHWLILVILALAQFMVVLDSSIVNVALPAMQQAFNLNASSLQWIVTAYTLTFGGFLLLGGRAADLYGRRKTFMIGAALFGIASLADGLAQSGTMLIILRALQGLAAAFMSPAALSIVLITYREGHERNRALSVWGAVASGGAAAGVLLGGILTEYLNWRWNFFINLPISAIVLWGAYRFVPKHEAEEKHNDLDLPGAISVTGSLLMLVYGLVEAPSRGWTAVSTLTYLAISVVLMAFFIWNEQHAKRPLMPLRLFKIRNVTGANLNMLPVMAGMFATFFFTSLYVQGILGYSPVRTGLAFLLVPISVALSATSVPNIIKRVGFKPVLVAAPLLIALGLFLLAHVPLTDHYWTHVMPGLVIMGLGAGASFVGVTIAATSGVPGHEAGLASGLLNTTQQVGGSLGLAILSGVASSRISHALATGQTNLALAQLQGYHAAYYAAVGFAIGASILAALVIKQPKQELARLQS